MILGICKCWRLDSSSHHGFISLWSFVFELPCKTIFVPIQLLAYLGWPPHAHKSTPRFLSLHLKAPACMEGSFIKWRTLPLIVLKSFAIWMQNLYSGEGLLPWAPLNFQGYIPLGYCPQIMGPLGACISLYVKPTLAVSFLVLEERTLHPWIMPWCLEGWWSPHDLSSHHHLLSEDSPHTLCWVKQWDHAQNAELGMNCVIFYARFNNEAKPEMPN